MGISNFQNKTQENHNLLLVTLYHLIIISNPSVGTQGHTLYDSMIANMRIPSFDWFKNQCNLQAAQVQLRKHSAHLALVMLLCFESWLAYHTIRVGNDLEQQLWWVKAMSTLRRGILFLRFGLPSTLIRRENGAFRKRPSKRRNLKTPAFHFRVDGKQFEKGAFRKIWRHDNHMTCLTEFSSNTNPKWTVIVAFLNSSRVV